MVDPQDWCVARIDEYRLRDADIFHTYIYYFRHKSLARPGSHSRGDKLLLYRRENSHARDNLLIQISNLARDRIHLHFHTHATLRLECAPSEAVLRALLYKCIWIHNKKKKKNVQWYIKCLYFFRIFFDFSVATVNILRYEMNYV